MKSGEGHYRAYRENLKAHEERRVQRRLARKQRELNIANVMFTNKPFSDGSNGVGFVRYI